MGWFNSDKYEVRLDAPGRLIYRECNNEYVFLVYDDDGETVIVGQPSGRRVFLFFGWYRIPVHFSVEDGERILPRLIDHFRRLRKRARLFDHGGADGESFVFHPELFEYRSRASDVLSEAGIDGFSHYSSIDLLHEDYGLEVCGIRDGGSVEPVVVTMKDAFPQWHFGGVCCKDCGREPGWKVSRHMFRRRGRGDGR